VAHNKRDDLARSFSQLSLMSAAFTCLRVTVSAGVLVLFNL
jgi:hypothetical protein